MAHIRSRPNAFYQCRSPSTIAKNQRNLTQRTRRRPTFTPETTVHQPNLISVSASTPAVLQVPFIYNKSKYHTMHIMRFQSGLINGPDTVPEGAPGNVTRDNTQLMGMTGEYSRLGTESAEYFLVDTDPKSETSPYDYPRNSGRQLRYGGRDFSSKDGLEAFGHVSDVGEGPEGSTRYGMV